MRKRKTQISMLIAAILLCFNVAATCFAEEALTAMDYFRTAVSEYGENPYTGAQKDGAIKLYTRAIRLDPEYHQAYNARGHMFALLNEYPQAIKDYSKAIEQDPNQAEYWYNRGTIYGYMGEYEKAVNDLTKAIELNPQHAAAYYERGAELYGLGKKSESKKDYETAVGLNPKYNGYGDYKKILESLKHTIWKDLNKRAGNYEGAGVYQSAAAFYEITDRLKPVTEKSFDREELYNYIDRAKIYAKVGRYQRAVDVVDMGLKRRSDPSNYSKCEFHMWRGVAYAGMGNKEQALKDFEEAIKARAVYPETYLVRGECYEKFGDYEAAIENYMKAPNIGGGGGADFKAEAYSHAARLYHKLGDYAAAKETYAKVVEIVGNHQSLTYMGKKEVARLNIVPGILVSWEYFYWGEALEYLGQYEEAKARYQSAFKSNREIKPYVPQKYWIDLEDDGLPIKMGGDLH